MKAAQRAARWAANSVDSKAAQTAVKSAPK